MVVFVEMLALSERALVQARMLSCLCADVNNTFHDSCCLQLILFYCHLSSILMFIRWVLLQPAAKW
jgi:hypothetical protein